MDEIKMISPLDDLIELCRSHPDYSGTLVTSDLPPAVLQAAYEALEAQGDDLSGMVGIHGARGHNRKGECVLVVVPPAEEGQWVVRFADTGKPKVDWPAPTPKPLEDRLRSVVGNRISELKALRAAVEEVWRQAKQKAEIANQDRHEGPWESFPDRGDDEILAEALIRYRKG